jgi:HEPN domain
MTAAIDKQAQILLAKAAEDETVILLPAIPDSPFGFHVQQAVEKLLKALLSQLSVQYRHSHDLNYLVKLLHTSGELLPQTVMQFSQLDSFAVSIAITISRSFRSLIGQQPSRPCA